jgi:hypothetical protein
MSNCSAISWREHIIFNEMLLIMFDLYFTNTLYWIVIVITETIVWVDMSLHWETLCWFRTNQFFVKAAYIEKRQKMQILQSLVWPHRVTNRSSTRNTRDDHANHCTTDTVSLIGIQSRTIQALEYVTGSHWCAASLYFYLHSTNILSMRKSNILNVIICSFV